jgi:Zn-dependent protease with chaperone function
VLAHEAAHVLSDHVLYFTALEILLRLGGGLPVIAGLPLASVRTALLEWSRAAELSCDRAAALVTRNPESVCRTLLILAGGTAASELSLDAFMVQGLEYREGGGGLDKLSRLLLELNITHPLPVRRVHGLMEWVRSGDYDRIVGGEYARRGEEPPVREEAGEAMTHYAERFRKVFNEAGEAVGQATDQLAEWLRRRP